MKARFVLFYTLFILLGLAPAKALLIKSNLEGETQDVTIYFTTRKLSRHEIDSICRGHFTPDEFSHDGLWRELSQDSLSPIITRTIGWDSALKDIKNINFRFENISSDSHFDLLRGYVGDFNEILYNITEGGHFRLKNLEATFDYEDSVRDAEKIRTFKEFLEEFKQRRKTLESRRRAAATERREGERQFARNNGF